MEMKEAKKRIVVFLFAMLLLVNASQTIYAAPNIECLGAVVDGSVLTNDLEAESTLINPARGNILNQGTTRLTNKGDGVVNVYGAVIGSVVCDKMILKMTLQRLQNGTWVDVKYYSDTGYNTGLFTKSYNTSVTKGYYYRVKAACVAQKGSTVESKMPITNGLWID